MSEDSSSSSSASSSSADDAGDIGAIKAKYASKRKDAADARKRRNRDLGKKKQQATTGAVRTKKPRATVKYEPTEKKPRKQPAITREEQVDRILQDYAYDKLQDLHPGAKITEQSCAILSDAIKAYIDEITARALQFSQETTSGGGAGGDQQKRQVVGHQAAWGAVRTLVPSGMTAAVLKTSIDTISKARGTQEPTEEAWRIYCNMSDQ